MVKFLKIQMIHSTQCPLFIIIAVLTAFHNMKIGKFDVFSREHRKKASQCMKIYLGCGKDFTIFISGGCSTSLSKRLHSSCQSYLQGRLDRISLAIMNVNGTDCSWATGTLD